MLAQRVGVSGDDEIFSATENRALGEFVLDAAAHPPAGQIHVDGHLVVQLDPLPRHIILGRMIHDLVEDDRAVEHQPRFERLDGV